MKQELILKEIQRDLADIRMWTKRFGHNAMALHMIGEIDTDTLVALYRQVREVRQAIHMK